MLDDVIRLLSSLHTIPYLGCFRLIPYIRFSLSMLGPHQAHIPHSSSSLHLSTLVSSFWGSFCFYFTLLVYPLGSEWGRARREKSRFCHLNLKSEGGCVFKVFEENEWIVNDWPSKCPCKTWKIKQSNKQPTVEISWWRWWGDEVTTSSVTMSYSSMSSITWLEWEFVANNSGLKND